MSKEIRQKSLDPKNYRNILKQLPKGMDIEYQLMNAFVNGKEPISALRSISINIRRLFIHAYQAYIFNRCLSNAIANGENLLRSSENDLCFEVEEGPLTFGRIRKFNSTTEQETRLTPAFDLLGIPFSLAKEDLNSLQKIMDEENVTPRDFYIKEMQELSNQGGFRQALLCCRDFTYKSSWLHLFQGRKAHMPQRFCVRL